MRFNVAVLLLGLFVVSRAASLSAKPNAAPKGSKAGGSKAAPGESKAGVSKVAPGESKAGGSKAAPGGPNAPEGSKLETAPKSSGGATTLVMWDIVSHIEAWMKEKGTAIEEAYALKGGWEGWAQVELALLFQKQKDFEGATISREDHVYEGTLRRDDLLIKKPSFTSMVELKCESKGNQDGFVKGVNDDLAKITGKIDAKYLTTHSTIWVIALGTSEHHAAIMALDKELKSKSVKVGKMEMVLWSKSKDVSISHPSPPPVPAPKPQT